MAGPVNITLRPPINFILRQSREFRRALDNLEPLWDRFGDAMEEIEQKRFDSEGPGWAELSDSTAEDRARHGFPPFGPILQREGDLMDSLTDAGRAMTASPQSMVWASDDFKAGWHQDGTDKMPARPVLKIETDDRRQLEREMVSWINDVSAKTWGSI